MLCVVLVVHLVLVVLLLLTMVLDLLLGWVVLPCVVCAPCVAYNGFRLLIGGWVVSPGPCALRLSCLGLVLPLPCLGCLGDLG